MAIGVLVGAYRSEPAPPEELPMGRAALRLEQEGVAVVFAHEAHDGRLHGLRARAGGWVAAQSEVVGVHDRFPSRSQPEVYATLIAGLRRVPRFNGAKAIGRCGDKARCPEVLTGPQPAIELDPACFEDRLQEWGMAFLKPRFGAFGVGVRQVVPGDSLPDQVMGPLGSLEPALLQRGIAPPPGWAGVACRVLVQRDGVGWWAETPVARCSRTDAVVNAARGAEVVRLQDRFPDSVQAVREVAIQTAVDLERACGRVVELGVDVVLDLDGQPWLVEVNARPRGRLEALASTDLAFLEAHVQACLRPMHAILRAGAAEGSPTGEESS